MQIKNYDEVKSQVRTHLSEYLLEQGIQNLKAFNCISSHEDKKPSAGVLNDTTHFHCAGCGFTGDIFDACHFLEKKPNSGSGFIYENLLYLANKYAIEVEATEMSEEELYKLDVYRVYDKVAHLLHESTTKTVSEEIEKRGWTEETLLKSHTGHIGSATLFKYLSELGFEIDFLEAIGIGRTDIFGKDRLVFTITDHHGKVVGFAARDLKWTKKSTTPKYTNFSTSGKYDVYQKGKRLYNLYNALPTVRQGDPLYIFEGYTDVLTAMENGLQNTCAIGGTGMTADHVLLIRELGIKDVVLCLDGDERGQERVQKILDNRLSGVQDVSIKIIIIPDSLDPDSYIHKYGINEFKSLAHWSAFEWRLLRFAEEDTEPEQICMLMVSLIANEPSYIMREKMCHTLSQQTGVSLRAVESELKRITEQKERKIAAQRDVILDKLSQNLVFGNVDAETFLSKAQTELRELSLIHNSDKLSPESCIVLLDEQKDEEENRSSEFQGFLLGEDLQEIQEALSGDWKKDVLLLFGGKPNSGKTSLLAKIAYEIAIHETNNACVIYHTIDDTASQFLPKWVCIAANNLEMAINEVRFPAYWQDYFGSNIDIRGPRQIGYRIIRRLMQQGRLILKDSNDGSSLASSENLIKYYQDRYPDRNVLYILDNMHKLRDFQGAGDERMRYKTISERSKDIATSCHVPFLASVEYTKLIPGVRPTNNNISETGQFEYDANLIVHMYNELHEMGEEFANEARQTHAAQIRGQYKTLPIIELNFGKNKISDFKNKVWLKMHPHTSNFRRKDTQEILQEMAEAAQENKDQSSTNGYSLFG